MMQEKKYDAAAGRQDDSVRIFAMTHKTFTPPPDSMYVPMQVGSACHDPLGYLRDDTGDNISDQNAYFSELTGVYWLWKNYRRADIIGICHYRRYLIAEDGHLYTSADIRQLLSNYDMIVTKKLELRMSYYDGFAATHDEQDLAETERVVAEKYPDYAPLFHDMVHRRETYFANMMICRKELYDAYCTWLFDILLEVQRRTDPSGYDNYRKRVYGFISEFLLTVWIAKNELHVYESRVGMSGEKYETHMLKAEMEQYFAAGDIHGAKERFLRELEQRPDLLMEASDIRGELKICMQIISTCEYEERRGEIRLVDRGWRFEELLARIKALNQFVLSNPKPSEISAYVSEYSLTDTAAEIAAAVMLQPAP